MRASQAAVASTFSMALHDKRYGDAGSGKRRGSLWKERREGRIVFLVLIITLLIAAIWLLNRFPLWIYGRTNRSRCRYVSKLARLNLSQTRRDFFRTIGDVLKYAENWRSRRSHVEAAALRPHVQRFREDEPCDCLPLRKRWPTRRKSKPALHRHQSCRMSASELPALTSLDLQSRLRRKEVSPPRGDRIGSARGSKTSKLRSTLSFVDFDAALKKRKRRMSIFRWAACRSRSRHHQRQRAAVTCGFEDSR